MIGQVVVAVVLVAFVVRKAREEFDRVVESNHLNDQVSVPSEARLPRRVPVISNFLF